MAEKEKYDNLTKGILGCAVGSLVLFTVCIIGCLSITSNTPPPTAKELQERAEAGAIYASQELLRANLNDPSSLQIVSSQAERKKAGDGYVVGIRYRAKNAFGAYILSEQIFVVDNNGNVLSTMTP